MVRGGYDVFNDLQGRELPADADGVLVWGPAADDFPVEDAVTCAVVTRTEESWWVLTGREASAQEWTLFGEDADIEGLLPCPALELAAVRRYVTGAAVVDVPHGANTPMTWVVAGAAGAFCRFARSHVAPDAADGRLPPGLSDRERAEVLTSAADVLLGRMVGAAFLRLAHALPHVMRLIVASNVDVEAMDPDEVWAACQRATNLVESIPWELCDASRLAAALGASTEVDAAWWGASGIGGLALLDVDHLSDSLEETFEVNQQWGQLAFTRLGSLFASHRGPHGVS
mgnify:FL=1